MRKTFHILSAMLICVLLLGTSACKKSKGQLLKYVPSGASLVVYGDLTTALEQIGISDGSLKDPLKSVLENTGTDSPEFRKFVKATKAFTNEFALFIQGKRVWWLFGLSDESAFQKLLEDNNFTVDKENGFTILSNGGGKICIKDGIAWMCIDTRSGQAVADTDTIKEFYDLGGDSFVKNDETKKLADNASDSDIMLYAAAKLNALASTFESAELSQVCSALSLAAADPKYLEIKCKLSDSAFELEGTLLNSKCEPAKLSAPVGKVDVKAIAAANVPGSWGCIAIDIPKELIQQIQNTVNSFGGGVQGPLGTILNSVAGTAALTINPVATTPGDYLALAVTCTSPEAASELGTMITSIPDFSKYNASTSGNILRICAVGGTASSSAPEFAKVLEGKTGGAVLDLDIFAKEAGINGSVGSLGKVVLCGESVDGGTKVKLTWKTDKPLTKVMKLVEVSGQLQNIARRIETSSDEFGEATYHNSYYDNSWDVPVDSVAVVDEDEPLTVYNPDYPY